MIATVINGLAIVIGTLAGIFLKKAIPEKFKDAIYTGIGIVTLVLGVSMAIKTGRVLWLTLSLLLGGLAGHLLDIDRGILKLGESLKKLFRGKSALEGEAGRDTFATGFLDSSVLFCTGAMALVGSFNAGTSGDFSLLLTKSVMDCFISVFMASVMGWGVLFSSITVFVYQGSLTLLAGIVKPWVSDVMLTEVSAIGGALLIMVGINLLKLREIKTANFLPALVFIVFFVIIEPFLPVLF